MIKTINILFSNQVSLYCYNSNNILKTVNNTNLIISKALLKDISIFGLKNNIHLNLLLSDNYLSEEHKSIFKNNSYSVTYKLAHNKLAHNIDDTSSILVYDLSDEFDFLLSKRPIKYSNMVIRITKNRLNSILDIFSKVIEIADRVNFIHVDLPEYTSSEFDVYKKQLEQISDYLSHKIFALNYMELNFLTDRLLLFNHNNCNAGIDHITVGPNGKCYICPAFYYDNPENNFGDIYDWEIPNTHLYEFENCPLCKMCDCYQCKRCIYLNLTLTGDVNIPSKQQCVLSHIERNASMKLLENEFINKNDFYPIYELDYLDPLDLIKGTKSISLDDRAKHVANILSAPLKNYNKMDIIEAIYKIEPMMLTKIKEILCNGNVRDSNGIR